MAGKRHQDQPGHVNPTTPAQPGERAQDELPARDDEQTEAVGDSPQDVAAEQLFVPHPLCPRAHPERAGGAVRVRARLGDAAPRRPCRLPSLLDRRVRHHPGHPR